MSAQLSRLNFDVTVRAPSGAPLAGQWVQVDLQGPGSLAINFDAKESRRETDADGMVRVTWFRRGVYIRDIHATLTVRTEREDASVSLEHVDEAAAAAEAGPWISWTPRRLKF
jgi:hypothetical protein